MSIVSAPAVTNGSDPTGLSPPLSQPLSPPGQWRILAPALLAWVLAALAVTHPGMGKWLCGLALVILLGTLAYCWMRPRLGKQFLAACAVLCSILIVLGARIDVSEWQRADPSLDSAAATHSSVMVRAVLTGFPESSRQGPVDRSWVRADVLGERGNIPVLLWLDAQPPSSWAPGTEVILAGRPDRFESGSSAAYGVSVQRVSVAPGERGAVAVAGTVAAQLRTSLHDAAKNVPGAELVPGFAVGDTSLVNEELELQMQNSSLTHLVAVSGANCALITSVVIAIAALCGVRRRFRIVLAAASLGAFVFVVGPDPSVQRAAVMASVMLISNYGGKRAVALPALGIAIVLLLCIDPWQAMQPGFALSVAATGGILLLVPTIDDGLRRRISLPVWVTLPISIALSAQLACGPLILLLQPGIPSVGVLANVLAGPAAPLGTGLGLLAMLLLQIFDPVGTGVLVLASLPARWVASTAAVTSQLPLARWHWPDGWPGAVLLALTQLMCIAGWLVWSGRVSLPRGRRTELRKPWGMSTYRPQSVQLVSAVLVCAGSGIFIGVTLLTPLAIRATTPHDWRYVACDVRQGDATLIRDPDTPEHVMLIDTGDDPELLRDCLGTFGVTRIAVLVLTHDDADHVGALESVLPSIDAAIIAPPNSVDGMERPVYEELTNAGVPVTIGEAGVTGGDLGLAWEVLAPAVGALPADTNSASLIIRVDTGDVRVMTLGDSGADEHQDLLSGGAELQADIVKVAHHGSRDQASSLLAAIEADLGTISVGKANGYGHPAKDTLAALETAGTLPLRTDVSGSIAISGDRGSLRVWVERGD